MRAHAETKTNAKKPHKDPCHPPLPRDLASSHTLRQARGHRLTGCVRRRRSTDPTPPHVPSLWPLTKTRPQNKEASLHPAGTCANEAASAPDSQGETVQASLAVDVLCNSDSVHPCKTFCTTISPAHKSSQSRRDEARQRNAFVTVQEHHTMRFPVAAGKKQKQKPPVGVYET